MNQLKWQDMPKQPDDVQQTMAAATPTPAGLAGKNSATVAASTAEEQTHSLAPVPDSRPILYDRLSPIRCFNYHAQLCVAGRLITESLEAGNSAVLILD